MRDYEENQLNLDIKENEFSPKISLNFSQMDFLRLALSKYRGIEEKKQNRAQTGFFDLISSGRDECKIKFHNHIGLVKLPIKKPSVLVIHPKFDVDTWGIMNFIFKSKFKVNFEEQISAEPTDDLNLILFRLFINHLELLWNNLKRYEYQEKKSHLKDIRGNINIFKTYMNIYQLKPEVFCQFEEFTLDQPFNQVLRYTLDLIYPQINSHPHYKQELGLKSYKLQEDMKSVTNRPFSITEIARFHYTNLTNFYFPIHQLCKLIIKNGFATPFKDNFYLFGFLINTWRLFEDFLHHFFNLHLPSDIICSFQESLKVMREGVDLRDRPDFILKADDWWAICDAKYKTNLTKEDYNQMQAYSSNIQNKQYIDSSEIPEKVSYVFLYPDVNDQNSNDFHIEDRGIYNVIHAPIRLGKGYIRNNRYLKKYIDQLIEIIS